MLVRIKPNRFYELDEGLKSYVNVRATQICLNVYFVCFRAKKLDKLIIGLLNVYSL